MSAQHGTLHSTPGLQIYDTWVLTATVTRRFSVVSELPRATGLHNDGNAGKFLILWPHLASQILNDWLGQCFRQAIRFFRTDASQMSAKNQISEKKFTYTKHRTKIT